MTREEAKKEFYDAEREAIEAHAKFKDARRPYEEAFPQPKPVVRGSEEDLRLRRLEEDVNKADRRADKARKAWLDELAK